MSDGSPELAPDVNSDALSEVFSLPEPTACTKRKRKPGLNSKAITLDVLSAIKATPSRLVVSHNPPAYFIPAARYDPLLDSVSIIWMINVVRMRNYVLTFELPHVNPGTRCRLY